jgi:hypothetical protein
MHIEHLRRRLNDLVGRPVVLRMNDNLRTMVSVRPLRPGPGFAVSLHVMFLRADDAVIAVLAKHIVSPGPGTREALEAFIAQHSSEIGVPALPAPSAPPPAEPEPPPPPSPAGKPLHVEELRRRLSIALARPVAIRVNDNRTTMLSVRPLRPGPGVQLSMHRMFLEADESMVPVLAKFITGGDDESRRRIRLYIAEHDRPPAADARPSPARRRRRGIGAQGRHYDLQPRMERILAEHFPGVEDVRIEWMDRRPDPDAKPRTLTLGHWDARARMVRVHPVLDHPDVPDYFLDFILFHELAHARVGARVDRAGRRMHHTREFYQEEARYPRLREAEQWEQKHFWRHYRAWNRGGAPAKDDAPTAEEQEAQLTLWERLFGKRG